MDNGSVLLQRVKRVLMRLFQYLMALGKYFIPYGGPELRSWPGKIRRLGQFLKDKKIDRLLLVTGESLMQNGVIRPALDSLDEAGIDYSVLTFDSPITTDQDVEEGYQVYVDRGREAILAIGGGTRIDCAKAIAARVARPELPAAAIAGYMRVRRRIPALVVIPTSAGTGSEASIEAVVKDSVSQKNMTIHDINLIPRYVLLDPELLRTLPRETMAMDGMDAMCRAVEAYINGIYLSPREKRMAEHAVRLLRENLVKACSDPDDLDARLNVQLAGIQAAQVANRGRVGYANALAYAMGEVYGLPHSQCTSMVLSHVLWMYQGKDRDQPCRPACRRMARLSRQCGFAGTRRDDAMYSESSRDNLLFYLIQWIDYTCWQLQIPLKADLFADTDFEALVQSIRRHAEPWYPVPEFWDTEDFEFLFKTLRK